MTNKNPQTQKSKSKGRGRPKGKRSDPRYIFFGGYIKRTTYRAVKKAAASEDFEYSELIQQLLDDWLAKRKKAKIINSDSQ